MNPGPAAGGDVEAVLFDLDNTICEYPRSDEELLALAFEEAGVDPFFEPAAYHETIPEYIDDCDDPATLRRRCFADIARRRGRDPEEGRAVAAAYTANRSPSDVEFRPGAEAVLSAFADAYALGLVTNGDRDVQLRKLRGLGIESLFDALVFAGDTAPAKPSPEPVERALARLGTAAERAVYVGDSLETDVPSAAAAGVRAVLVGDDPGDADGPAPDFVVGSLRDLRPPPWRERSTEPSDAP